MLNKNMTEIAYIKKTEYRHCKGFTLLELLVIIAIIGLLAAIMAPSYSVFLARNELKSSAMDVKSFIQEARLKAMNFKRPVRMVVLCTNKPIEQSLCTIQIQEAVFVKTGTDFVYDIKWKLMLSKQRVLNKPIRVARSGGVAVPEPARFRSWMVADLVADTDLILADYTVIDGGQGNVLVFMPDGSSISTSSMASFDVYSVNLDGLMASQGKPSSKWVVAVNGNTGNMKVALKDKP